jgi:LPS-assembly protein
LETDSKHKARRAEGSGADRPRQSRLPVAHGPCFAAALMRRLAFALALALAGSRALAAIAGQPYMDADTMEGDLDTHQTFYRGHARMRDGPAALEADTISYDEKTDTVIADGHVALTRGEERLLADHLTYRRADGSFSAVHVRVGRYPFCLEGESAEGTRTRIVLHKARVTYGEPGPWQPTVKAETIVFEPGNYLRFAGSLVGLGDRDILPIPQFRQDFSKDGPLSRLTLDLGYRSSLGASADVGLHLPVLPGASLGGDVGLYTARGVMAGPTGTYRSADGSGDLAGSFSSGYIHDLGSRGNDLFGRPIQADRAFLEMQHRQELAPNLTVTADINYWSDPDVTRDFRPNEFYQVQMPDTYVESVYAGANTYASLFARFRPNTFEPVQERLPELRFDLLPTQIGQGFYERLDASAVSLQEWPPGGGRELASDRLDAVYEVSRPIAPAPWASITPVAGVRITNYSDTVGAALPGGTTRAIGELGFDAQLRSSGTFAYSNPTWDIDGLRHLFTPTLSYRYIPDADRGSRYIPAIDRDTFNTYLPTLDLADMRAIDSLHPLNTLRMGIENTLQTRDAGYGSRDLFAFNVADDLNFIRQPGEPDYSDLHTQFLLSPAPWITYDVEQIVAPRSMTLREFDSGLILKDGREWQLRVSTDFLRHEDNDYLLDFRQALNEEYQAVLIVQYGARQHRVNDLETGLMQNLSNTWSVRYLLTFDSGTNREGHFGFTVQVEAIRF